VLTIFISPLQLNFYSFRKINRERNVWIYKHKLFHRDRPEDLHLVRRRTCPGVDGRKQRFSRYSAQKISKFGDEKINESDDDTSLGDSSGDESARNRKRSIDESRGSNSSSKRSRRSLWYGSSKPAGENVLVDTSVISNSTSPTGVLDANTSLFQKEIEEEDDSSAKRKNNRMEAIEQAMIVSEVASKLEEHVKKVMKGRGSSRTRRANAGVVTPPYGSYQKFEMSSRDLITYDDEYEEEDAYLVSDADEESVASVSVIEDEASQKTEVPKDLIAAPVQDKEKVKKISDQIRLRAQYSFYYSEMIHACASVAELFMSTAPTEDAQLVSEKVLELLSSSGRLASDFHFYRAALHPENASEDMLSPVLQTFEQHHAVALRRSLERGASKLDALREFKIFCVNLIYKLLGKNGSFDIQEPFSATDRAILLQTAEAWSKTVGTSA
jgi:hypothetical protein